MVGDRHLVWRDRKGPLFRKLVAGLANVGVHPEQFLQNDNSRSWRMCFGVLFGPRSAYRLTPEWPTA